MWLFVLFLAIPLIEIGLFIQVGGFIGLWWTLGIVVLTAFLGTRLIRSQGVMAMNDVQSSFRDLRDPTEPLAHGAMILFSGALLLTPGFFTDAVGFALLVPAVRRVVFKYVRSRVKVTGFTVGGGPAPQREANDGVIDGEFEEIDIDTPTKEPGNSGWTKH
ncbi:MAG: FxsA family protein [Paracoccaceae bacterium]